MKPFARGRYGGHASRRSAFGDCTTDSRGTPVARNAALFGLGMAVNERTTIVVSYQGQFASEVRKNAVTGTDTFRF